MSTFDVVLVVVRLAIGWWLLAVPGRLRPGGPQPTGAVSIVVPARDEAGSVPALLGSLPEGVEVVVVDDGSTDATADVARRGGATVVAAGPLPEGWTGKVWACHRGAGVATGDVLAFVDADVTFDPGGVEAVLAELRRRGGLVSVQPTHVPVRPVEHLAHLFNVVGFAGTDAGSPVGRWWGTRGAFGPVLATSRADHARVGGHEAIRGSVVDDVDLAARYRDAGLPVTVLAGADLVRFRMYPGGLRPLSEGFSKNLVAGARAVRRSTTAAVAAWMTLLVQAAVAPVRAVATGQGVAVAAVLYGVVAAQLWWMGRRVGRFAPWVAAIFPVSVLLFLVVFARSSLATARGQVSWRGRQVPVDRRRSRHR